MTHLALYICVWICNDEQDRQGLALKELLEGGRQKTKQLHSDLNAVTEDVWGAGGLALKGAGRFPRGGEIKAAAWSFGKNSLKTQKERQNMFYKKLRQCVGKRCRGHGHGQITKGQFNDQ